MTLPSYLHFWGKAGGARPDDPLTWHPLAYHCLDVAAVADDLLVRNPRRLAAMARLAGTENLPAFRNFLVAMVALHDIGKFATTFQAKAEQAWPTDMLGPRPKDMTTDGDHALLASRARHVLGIRQGLQDWTGDWESSDLDIVWHAVSGHHGIPKAATMATNARDMMGAFPKVAVDAACAFRDDVIGLFPERAQFPATEMDERRLHVLSWAIAGLAVAADWIGSRRAWFAYAEPKRSLADYWAEARAKAASAVERSGILRVPANDALRMEDILPAGRGASPLQRMIAETELPDGPLLAIVEDVTGSGKTEAALMLAALLVARESASGLFIALPTMATANAMYDRMRQHYRRVFSDSSAPSLALAHGRRALNDGFQASILGVDETPDTSTDGDHADDGAAMCSAWLADDRRKALLAHVGVGTIDQALLAVLPSKYQSLRLWGLADKVLILDEVHAFDAYMSREIETLLEFQAALGGSAILLSATLPVRQRSALEAAFLRGLGAETGVREERPTDYPLVTFVSRTGPTFAKPATRPDRARSVAVRRIASIDEAADHVVRTATSGGCVAWIRNSVDDAIEAVDLVRARYGKLTPVLLHARFAMGDRLAIEKNVCQSLGRGENAARKGFVLIGTQILEASLDYDVDAMVTDIAPIDLIIQRAGRLWRHADRRARPVSAPELLVLSSEATPEAGPDWYSAVSRRAPHVYQHHGIVWRSAAKLMSEGYIATPEGVRGLVEAVYGRDRSDIEDVPKALQRASHMAFGADMAAQSFAKANLLEVADGYAGSRQIWTPDAITPTRLGEPVTVFRLGRWDGGEIVPYFEGVATMKNWALSEVSLSQRKAIDVPKSDTATERAIACAKEKWPKWECNMPLLVVTPKGAGWKGAVTKDGTTAIDILYDKTTGLRPV